MIFTPPGDAAGRHLGGKAANLLRVAAAGLPVPRWIAIPADVHESLVLGGTPPPAAPEHAERRRQETLALAVPAELRAEVMAALRDAALLGRPLAVRSSATSEDSATASFAGQFETVLGVVARSDDDAALWDAIRQVWASAFGLRALAYAGGTGTLAPPPAMAVIIQELVDARAAGVAFSVDPVTGDPDSAVVSAVYGLGEGLVSGELDADTYRVRGAGRFARVELEPAYKEDAHVRAPAGGTRHVVLPESLRRAPSISEPQAIEVATAARTLADALGAPQDVEWAYASEDAGGGEVGIAGTSGVATDASGTRLSSEDAGAIAVRLRPRARERLLILQSRPVTAAGAATPAGELRVWDNSNIIESYAGLTSPLTFSFARSAYEDVYLQFCRVVGVSERVIEEQRHVFPNMLGLIRGRVYYNLLNWYRIIAMLPGYAFNREFMERMMGVREKLAEPPDPPRAANRWVDLGRLLRMAARLERANRELRREVPAFHARVDAALAPLAGADLVPRAPDELLRLYRDLETKLLHHWRAPLVNDLFAMIWFGVLGRLVEKWLPTEPATLANDLLCGEGGIVSTEPARRVMALARTVAEQPALAALFAAEPDDHALLRRIQTEDDAASLRAGLKSYLDRFGDRCMSELKLETVTPAEDPTWVVTMVRAYAAGGATDADAGHERERAIRSAAERRVAERLPGLRRRVFMRVLRSARLRIRDRENLRFERTRVFGVVRRIFLAFGNHFARAGRIAEARDIFWLTKEEIFAEVDGTSTTRELRALVALRKAEYAGYEAEPAPPDRFTTRGLPGDAVPSGAAGAAAEGDLRGIGCCPGVVRAEVRVVHDPKDAGDLNGRIMVAERTDPGWTLLFPTASGLLVQRGSLLSHSAIVAREMGIPCVVAIPGLLDTLRDGERVEMDGTTGVVRRLTE